MSNFQYYIISSYDKIRIHGIYKIMVRKNIHNKTKERKKLVIIWRYTE
jgi:hypothetical protein